LINPFEPAIYKRPEIPNAENPYHGDELGRHKLANQLEAYIDRLPDGAVISIDASWGQGKTWFALNWHNDWKAKGGKSIYIDAFKSDFIEDPFVMITGEIVSALHESEGTKSNLIEAGVKAIKVFTPVIAVTLLNTAAKLVTGSNDAVGTIKIAGDAFTEESQKALSEGISNSIKNYSRKKSDLDSFNAILRSAVEKNIDGKPLLIFIDELDRCRPDFAIKTIERIKHYFDVPGIIFILLMNRNQMLETIKGAYGVGIDAETYIRKFIQLNVSFPKVRIGHDPSININNYCLSTMARHGFKKPNRQNLLPRSFPFFLIR
jgi:predicted KAP-like P-loop ATPase